MHNTSGSLRDQSEYVALCIASAAFWCIWFGSEIQIQIWFWMHCLANALLLNCIKLPWFAVFVKLRERPVLHSGILSKLVDFCVWKTPDSDIQRWLRFHVRNSEELHTSQIPRSDLKITCQNWCENFWQFDTVWPLFHLVKCMDFGLLNTLFALLAVLIWILKRGDFGSEGRTCTNCRLPMFLGETLDIWTLRCFILIYFDVLLILQQKIDGNWGLKDNKSASRVQMRSRKSPASRVDFKPKLFWWHQISDIIKDHENHGNVLKCAVLLAGQKRDLSSSNLDQGVDWQDDGKLTSMLKFAMSNLQNTHEQVLQVCDSDTQKVVRFCSW